MANYAFLNLWFREFNITRGLAQLEKALTQIPVSSQRPGFGLLVRSLDPGQSPSLEAELLATPADVCAAASEFLHEDTAYAVTAHWDLWQPHEDEWEQSPTAVEFLLHGEEFDDARYRDAGHLQINLGPEQLYLGLPDRASNAWLRPVRENLRRIYAFMRALEKELLISERRLWSEGEPDFNTRSEQLFSGAITPPAQDSRP